MEFTHLLAIVGDEPVFATDLLLAGAVDADDVRRQLSRWVSAGRLYRLRRGLYALAPPFQRPGRIPSSWPTDWCAAPTSVSRPRWPTMA
ncbi:MAG: type IV toxin-antitoxin system AbiEi family antitoxin domain-containing protein [Anaerolineae bacterium]|uniref:type IV toxin-antitoxin system AbiEi family antitoxin domain-containing protein n=1 Tax=Candidatus Amarolinea dominans TaxID=3140696 RepID=UPI0031375004|nr:type IV toxin-antitoxin system AbiEi family antitoxin domain-containing protein [Anaerolineae bacterium]